MYIFWKYSYKNTVILDITQPLYNVTRYNVTFTSIYRNVCLVQFLFSTFFMNYNIHSSFIYLFLKILFFPWYYYIDCQIKFMNIKSSYQIMRDHRNFYNWYPIIALKTVYTCGYERSTSLHRSTTPRIAVTKIKIELRYFEVLLYFSSYYTELVITVKKNHNWKKLPRKSCKYFWDN